MENEEIVMQIQQGKDELIIVLWEQVKSLLYKKSCIVYNTYKSRFNMYGVELSDIQQCCYFVLLKAVKAYDSTKEYKFTSYLSYPFKNEINALLGYRTNQKPDPLNNCYSLDMPFTDDEKCSLSECVPDTTALDFVSELDRRADSEIIQAEVYKLPEKLKNVIIKHWFENVTYKDIAAFYGVSDTCIKDYERKGFNILKKNPVIKEIHGENLHHRKQQAVAKNQYNPEFYKQIKILDKSTIQERQEKLKADIQELADILERWKNSEIGE